MHVRNRVSVLGLFIWLIAAFFFLYEFFLRTFVGSIASELIHQLHLTVEQFTMIGSAYYIAYAVMQIPVGILSDKFGVKKIMVFATFLCAAATFLFASSHGFVSAVLSRFFMGFASSFAFICLLVIAVNWFPRRFFGFFSGASQFIGTMGPALAGGPLISWILAAHISWRVALTYIGSFGIVLCLLSLFFVKGKPSANRERLLFLSRDKPLKGRLKRLLKNKQAWVVASYSATLYVSIAVMAAVWGTSYLESRGLSESYSAYMVSTAWLCFAIGCPLFGFLSDIIKRRKPFLVGCALLGLISTTAIVFFSFQAHWVYIILFGMLGLAATGQSVGFPAIAEHVEADVRATALGLNNGAMTLFAALLPLLIGYLINLASHGSAQGHLTTHALVSGLITLPIMYAAALIISVFFFKETFCRSQNSATVIRIR